MNSAAENAVIRSLCFHEAWHYAPTRAEFIALLDVGDDADLTREAASGALDGLLRCGIVTEREGRVGFPGSLDGFIETFHGRDALQPRKRRRARIVVRWLARLCGVRFVALANTAALGNSRDEGDLDLFVVTCAGSIWSTRMFSGAPFKLFGWMPSEDHRRDAVCLSYFISDRALDLASQMLTPDDPYFRYWLLSLVPLFDDGVSTALWDANAAARRRHPFAEKWIPPPDLVVQKPLLRLPVGAGEWFARVFQLRWFPVSIRNRMNTDTTVMVSDDVLKFHVTDARADYRRKYEELCRKKNVNA